MFGIRTVTDGDIRTFQAHGFVCKLLATAKAAEGGVCAYIEPTLVDSHELEAAVPKNFNLITYSGEKIGRHSFFGQGRDATPPLSTPWRTAWTFWRARAASIRALCSHRRAQWRRRRHPYYVRTACPDEFLQGITVERWARASSPPASAWRRCSGGAESS